MVDHSFVPSSKQPSEIYCRLTNLYSLPGNLFLASILEMMTYCDCVIVILQFLLKGAVHKLVSAIAVDVHYSLPKAILMKDNLCLFSITTGINCTYRHKTDSLDLNTYIIVAFFIQQILEKFLVTCPLCLQDLKRKVRKKFKTRSLK